MTGRGRVDEGRLHDLLRRLLDIYSPSGKEEAVVELLVRYFEAQGLKGRRQPVDELRSNLIVPLGPRPKLALVGHLDTVPAHDLDDLGYRREGDQIFGLGAADMKGGCAALIEACLTVRAEGRGELPVVLCLVVGEEEYGDGAERLVEEVRAPFAIVAEPTDLVPCFGQVGYVEVELEARGSRRHASLAAEPSGAVTAMLRLLIALSDHFGPRPEVALNIRGLASSPSGFVVPERATAMLDLHVSSEGDIGELTAELEELVARRSSDLADAEIELSFEMIDQGYSIPQRGQLHEALRQSFEARALPFEPSTFRSHSDASCLWASGIRPVVLGPGRLESAHAPGESVALSQVVAAAELYAELIRRFEGLARA